MAEEKNVNLQDEAEETGTQVEEEVSKEISDEEVTEETNTSGGESKKSKLFKKKKELKDKKDEMIDDLKGKLDDHKDKLTRQMAEFDNFRKRTNQEKAGMYVVGAKEIVEKMLPILDSFERGLAAVPEEEKDSSFAEGMTMIYKQMLKALEDVGVTPIVAVGEEFNPDLHNAVMHIESDEVGDNIVVEELQKGYRYKDFVVRHSMVKVAN